MRKCHGKIMKMAYSPNGYGHNESVTFKIKWHLKNSMALSYESIKQIKQLKELILVGGRS